MNPREARRLVGHRHPDPVHPGLVPIVGCGAIVAKALEQARFQTDKDWADRLIADALDLDDIGRAEA